MDKAEKEVHKIAKERLAHCIDLEEENRKRQLDDLKFSTLDQWPEEMRSQRENDPNGARPCLTIDKINQYIVQVANDMQRNKPGVKARPVDNGADIETADIYAGIVRFIEDISNSNIAYSVAGESQVRIGEGYFRIVTDYIDEKSFNQMPFIKPIIDRFSVYLGPHTMPDGSDAEYGFIFEDVQLEKFKRDWPKAKTEKEDFDDGNNHFRDEKTIRVAEYFYFDEDPTEIVMLEDGSVMEMDEYEKNHANPFRSLIVDKRTTTLRKVKWCKLTGAETLESNDWAGKYIPIVKVTGKSAIVEGKRSTWGLVRPAMDSLRMYNYVSSLIVEKMMLNPKTPFVGAVGQFATKANDWARANTDNLAFLEYDPVDVNGMALPAPQRQQPSQFEPALVKQLELIEHDIQTSLGMFKASVGESDPQQSGRAILALQKESDTGTSHFPEAQAISIRHCGRILVDLIPKVMDTATIARIMGLDGKVSSVQLDPNQPESVKSIQMNDGSIKKIYNLGVGTYDVTVTVGPSYNTRRMEAAEMLVKMNEGDPTFKQVAGDILFDSMDWPDGLGQKLAARYKKMLPPPLQEGQPQIPPEVQQQIQQMEEQLQQMGQENQQLKTGQQESMAKIQLAGKESEDKKQIKFAEINAELELKKEAMQKELALMVEKFGAEGQVKREIALDGTSSEIDAALAKVQAMVQLHEQKMMGLIQGGEKDAQNSNMAASGEDNFAQMNEMHGQFMEGIGQIMQALTAKKMIIRDAQGRATGVETVS